MSRIVRIDGVWSIFLQGAFDSAYGAAYGSAYRCIGTFFLLPNRKLVKVLMPISTFPFCTRRSSFRPSLVQLLEQLPTRQELNLNQTSFLRSDSGWEHLRAVPKNELEELFSLELKIVTSRRSHPCMRFLKLRRSYFAKRFTTSAPIASELLYVRSRS